MAVLFYDAYIMEFEAQRGPSVTDDTCIIMIAAAAESAVRVLRSTTGPSRRRRCQSSAVSVHSGTRIRAQGQPRLVT